MSRVADDSKLAPFDGLDSTTLPFWEAAAEGRLLIQQCGSCRERFFYARPFCPFCSSPDVEWLEASGRGEVYSYTVVAQTKPSPSVIAYVSLDEGPTLLTRIDTPDLISDHIGRRVKARFSSDASGRPLLLFEPS